MDLNTKYHRYLVDCVTQDATRANDAKPLWGKLFDKLDSVVFVSDNQDDDNRISDALELRERFIYENEFSPWDSLERGDATVLEVMVALAIRIEESIMTDPNYGDRTGQWFWNMIVSLGLGGLHNRFYDEQYVDNILNRWMNHEYEPNGKGSLFTVYSRNDMRSLSIWEEMNEYLTRQY